MARSLLLCGHNRSVVTVPAFVWRAGAVGRGLTVGVAAGAFFSGLAWLDSGMFLGGAIVFAVLSVGYGVWMGRRMVRYWPGAGALTGAQRVTVARAVRGDTPIADTGLAAPVIEYSAGLRAAGEHAGPLRWFVWVMLAVALGTALWDTAFGSLGNGIASAVYLALLGAEVFWWPRRQDELMANAEHAAQRAAKLL